GGRRVLCAARCRSRADPGPLRYAETPAGLVLPAFLVPRRSYDHRLPVVVELLLAEPPYGDPVARQPGLRVA
ncbi:hypothetical protein NGM37_56105, partial [Streptomyces sp. TRM76130]|nr:hypothetical protein [Streptomyces sp. TRM76130]